jgi:hypothetical protein
MDLYNSWFFFNIVNRDTLKNNEYFFLAPLKKWQQPKPP